jgi:abortive infection bacteriophage resistance protein
MVFSKPATSVKEQLALLESRGMQIENKAEAEKCLLNLGYYRLSGYWWTMQADNVQHIFKPNTKWENVIQLYEFDRDLRSLLFAIIDRIEISFRTQVIYHLSNDLGSHWFQDPDFNSPKFFDDNLKTITREVERSKEAFMKEHKAKYITDTSLPPAWKTLEVCSLGTVSKLFSANTETATKDKVAKHFALGTAIILESWMKSISELRNLIAHHSRVWNRPLTLTPKYINNRANNWLTNRPDLRKLYYYLSCLQYMLNATDSKYYIGPEIKLLLIKYQYVKPAYIGFPNGWENEPVWQTK